jgi:hypothetical protein
VVAYVKGLIVIVGIFIINKGDSVLLGIVDDIGQQQIVVAEHNWTVHTAKLGF